MVWVTVVVEVAVVVGQLPHKTGQLCCAKAATGEPGWQSPASRLEHRGSFMQTTSAWPKAGLMNAACAATRSNPANWCVARRFGSKSARACRCGRRMVGAPMVITCLRQLCLAWDGARTQGDVLLRSWPRLGAAFNTLSRAQLSAAAAATLIAPQAEAMPTERSLVHQKPTRLFAASAGGGGRCEWVCCISCAQGLVHRWGGVAPDPETMASTLSAEVRAAHVSTGPTGCRAPRQG